MQNGQEAGLSTTETAKRLAVTDATVRRWCSEQGFGLRLFGRWRIPEAKVVEFENRLRGARGCQS